MPGRVDPAGGGRGRQELHGDGRQQGQAEVRVTRPGRSLPCTRRAGVNGAGSPTPAPKGRGVSRSRLPEARLLRCGEAGWGGVDRAPYFSLPSRWSLNLIDRASCPAGVAIRTSNSAGRSILAHALPAVVMRLRTLQRLSLEVPVVDDVADRQELLLLVELVLQDGDGEPRILRGAVDHDHLAIANAIAGVELVVEHLDGPAQGVVGRCRRRRTGIRRPGRCPCDGRPANRARPAPTGRPRRRA